jgi:hypothetical protein
MLKLTAPLAALAMLVAGSALATEKIGKIVKIDPARDQVQVENVTLLLDGAKIDNYKVGDEVSVNYYEDDLGDHLQSIKKQ